MPTLRWLLLVLAAGLCWTGCRSGSPHPANPSAQNPFFPLLTGNCWVYRDLHNPQAFFFIHTAVVGDNRLIRLEEVAVVSGKVQRRQARYISTDSTGCILSSVPVRIARDSTATSVPEGDLDALMDTLFNTRAVTGREWCFQDPTKTSSIPPVFGSAFRVKSLGHLDTLRVGPTLYSDCLVFETSEHEDGVRYYLARDVGLVMFGVEGWSRYELCAYLLR